MLSVPSYVWWGLFGIFTIVPTIIFYKKEKFKKIQILIAIPFMYLLILTVLGRSIISELYGISSRGALDPTPAWVDAIFVTFIIIFCQYLGIMIVDFINKKKKKTKKNEK
jgi:hypothetical protein